jgi:phenylacetate-CoA ligase
MGRPAIGPVCQAHERFDTLAPEKAEQEQMQALRHILSHAVLHIPYYRDIFGSLGATPVDFRTRNDLAAIPPLSRETLQQRRYELIDQRYVHEARAADASLSNPGKPPRIHFRKRIVRNQSSGSTGAPTVFYEDGALSASNWANELRIKRWYGSNPGAREARLVRMSSDALRRDPSAMLRRLLWNQQMLPGVSLSEADYEQAFKQFEQFKPRVLWGFTSALTGLATYIRETHNQQLSFSPRVAVGWAAPMFEHERTLLESVFNAPACNIYSAREVGHIAAHCPHGAMHLFEESAIVEVNENPAHGEPGELLVTSLIPGPMPFIRYRMGDIGALAEKSCACGRTLRILEELTGRTNEIIVTSAGRMISPNFWCRTFMNPAFGDAIKRFQVRYRGDEMIIYLVRGRAYSADLEQRLRDTIAQTIGPEITVQFEYVTNIAPMVSGKYQMVINETGSMVRS